MQQKQKDRKLSILNGMILSLRLLLLIKFRKMIGISFKNQQLSIRTISVSIQLVRVPAYYSHAECLSQTQHPLECPHERSKVCCDAAQTFGVKVIGGTRTILSGAPNICQYQSRSHCRSNIFTYQCFTTTGDYEMCWLLTYRCRKTEFSIIRRKMNGIRAICLAINLDASIPTACS